MSSVNRVVRYYCNTRDLCSPARLSGNRHKKKRKENVFSCRRDLWNFVRKYVGNLDNLFGCRVSPGEKSASLKVRFGAFLPTGKSVFKRDSKMRIAVKLNSLSRQTGNAKTPIVVNLI